MDTFAGTPPLRELQQWLADLIVRGQPLSTPLLQHIEIPGGSVAERLAVHVNGYPARIQEALEEQFPAVAHIAGAGAFAALVKRYVEAVQLDSYTLSDAGLELPRFLRTDRLTAQLPFLVDLAQLEAHVARAFHAFDEPTLDRQAVTHWTPEQWDRATLRFQSWVAVMTSDWPVREIWDCREMPIEDIDIDLKRPDCVLVRRVGDTVICESVGRREADVLAALLAGRTLGTVVAEFASRGDDPAAVSTWFARWMALRLITGCEVGR